LQDLPTAAADDLDAIMARIVDAVARGDQLPAHAAAFLLRRYLASPRDDLTEPLGLALARALDADDNQSGAVDRAAHLMLFVDAAAIADDERIAAAAAAIVRDLQAAWPSERSTATAIAAGAATAEACLLASPIVGAPAIVPPAIDELEAIVAAAYRPGDGLLGGAAAAHVAVASALLTAFELTGRLPYSMLAEELMQPVRRAAGTGSRTVDCAAARVLCRLAALHDDREYRAAAVIAPDADYAGDAARILRSHATTARAAPLADAALYGLALGELMSLR